eukprot:598141-Amphidinium_carterae.2
MTPTEMITTTVSNAQACTFQRSNTSSYEINSQTNTSATCVMTPATILAAMIPRTIEHEVTRLKSSSVGWPLVLDLSTIRQSMLANFPALRYAAKG